MAFAGLLALLDDVASVLDDVATLTKVAARKTAGVVGDDLALNAQQVAGVRADRELPVVWAVAKGSFVNKLILVPAAIAISAFAPWAVVPMLMAGGAYLCYEGAEKIVHRFTNHEADDGHRLALAQALADPAVDLVALERERIRGAVRTDFVLSAEIIVIALGVAGDAPLATRAAVLSGIALAMTVGVYGLVAAIVKLDDAGAALARTAGEGAWAGFRRAAGRAILAFAPWFMKALAIVGTAAMFLVGGGILLHGISPLGHAVEAFASSAGGGGAGAIVAGTAPLLASLVTGVVAGLALVAAVALGRRALRRR